MDPTDRFTGRASVYAKYRPSYPSGVVETLRDRVGLDRSKAVADIGAGTGIFAALLSETGATVFAVEPNAEMRTVAEAEADGRYAVMDGSAEHIPLADGSVDLVTAAQSFHWFDRQAARAEFARVLKPPAWVALVWNVRDPGSTSFQAAYEDLLRRYAPSYPGARHGNDEAEDMAAFFRPGSFERMTFPNPLFLFWDELRGRALSASYFPLEGHPNHEPALRDLEVIFDKHKQGGRVDFDTTTELYLGRLIP